MFKNKFFWQMYLTAIIVGLIAAVLIYVRLAADLSSKPFIEAEKSFTTELFISSLLAETMLSGNFKYFHETRQLETSKRLIVISREGSALYDSHGPIDDKNYIDHPEIIEAKIYGTGSARHLSPEQGSPMLSIAKRIDADGQNLGYALLIDSLEPDSTWSDMVLDRLLYFFFMAFILYSLGTYLLTQYFYQPINRATNYARRLSQGNYIERLPAKGQDDIAILEGALNDLALSTEDKVSNLDQNVKDLSSMLEALNEGVIAIDANNLIIHINSSAMRLFSLEKSPIGKNLVDITSLKQVWHFANPELNRRDDVANTIEFQDQILEISAIRIIQGSNPEKLLISIQDITERTIADNIRIDFVANASHELKTPITAIQAMIETIIDSPKMLKTTRNEFLLKISNQTNRLSATVSQLLQLTRSQKVLDSEQAADLVDLNVLLEQTILDQEDLASSKNIIIELQKQSKPVYVKADSESLRPVFQNLIENGINYSKPDTSVQVSISVNTDQCFITIKDHGLGMPKAEHQRVFERFYRLDKGRAWNKGGTGLGLSIAKAAIQAHKGTITLKSSVNKGSEFKVSLPLHQTEP